MIQAFRKDVKPLAGSKLKIELRKSKILKQLELAGKVSVAELSQMLGVTPVTIRTDLTELEQEGRLIRIQGGAVPLSGTGEAAHGAPVANLGPKQAIGEAVARLVRDGDTLFINSGTTCEQVAAALGVRKNLNIVTNALQVAMALGDVPSFRVLLVGGELNAQYGFTHGGDAQEQLSKYQADWSILAVDGISVRGGVTTHHAEEAIIDRIMASGSARTLIVADGTKIGRTGFSRVCECGPGLTLVTDPEADLQALSRLEALGIKIVKD